MTHLVRQGLQQLGAAYLFLAFAACNPSNNPQTSQPAALAVTTAHPAITLQNTVAYTVSGGAAPYTVSVDHGTLSSAVGSGIYTPASLGTAQISIQDSLGASATVSVTVEPNLSIGENNIPPAFMYAEMTAVQIANKMYAYGGFGANGGTTDLLEYDSTAGAQGTWHKLAPSGTAPAASCQASAAIGGKMYVFGGWGTSSPVNSLWVYNPASGAQGSWTSLTPSGTAPAARSCATAVSIDGKMYVFGGALSPGQAHDVWAYDPSAGAQGSWTNVTPSSGPAPSGRQGSGSAVLAGKMIIYSGAPSGAEQSNDLWSFDPIADAWTSLTPSGTPPPLGWMPQLGVIHDKLYVFGGNSGVSSTNFNGTYVYDPASGSQGSWTQLTPASPPSPRALGVSGVFADQLLIFGGNTDTGYVGETWLYDPASGSQGAWTEATALIAESGPIVVNSTFPYGVSGGVAPFTITADRGSVDNSQGAGTYTAPATATTSTLTVTDALGNMSTWTMQSVIFSLAVTIPEIGYSDSVAYTITGGSGNVTVSTNFGCVDNVNGSGSYTGCGNSGTDTITVIDNVYGLTITVNIIVDAVIPPTISLGATEISNSGSTTYTVASGSGDYSVYANFGYVDNGSGSGNYSGNGGSGVDTIYVYDNVTGVTVSADITVDP